MVKEFKVYILLAVKEKVLKALLFEWWNLKRLIAFRTVCQTNQ
jgi:hypothetical protein